MFFYKTKYLIAPFLHTTYLFYASFKSSQTKVFILFEGILADELCCVILVNTEEYSEY